MSTVPAMTDVSAPPRTPAPPDLASSDLPRFIDVPLRPTGSSALVVAGAAVWSEWVVHDERAAGDHVVVHPEEGAPGADPSPDALVLHELRSPQLPQTHSTPTPASTGGPTP